MLGDAAAHEVHVTGAVPLHLQRTRPERPLLSDEDVEVVVGGVEAPVSLRIERRAKDNQVLRDARVDHVHRPHRAARVVEHLFRAVRVDRDARAWVRRGQIGDDVRDHTRCVVGRCGERGQLELVNKERTLTVSGQLNVASVRSRKMARVAHLVSWSHFWEIFGSGVLGVGDPHFFPDILEGVRRQRARTEGASLGFCEVR